MLHHEDNLNVQSPSLLSQTQWLAWQARALAEAIFSDLTGQPLW